MTVDYRHRMRPSTARPDLPAPPVAAGRGRPTPPSRISSRAGPAHTLPVGHTAPPDRPRDTAARDRTGTARRHRPARLRRSGRSRPRHRPPATRHWICLRRTGPVPARRSRAATAGGCRGEHLVGPVRAVARTAVGSGAPAVLGRQHLSICRRPPPHLSRLRGSRPGRAPRWTCRVRRPVSRTRAAPDPGPPPHLAGPGRAAPPPRRPATAAERLHVAGPRRCPRQRARPAAAASATGTRAPAASHDSTSLDLSPGLDTVAARGPARGGTTGGRTLAGALPRPAGRKPRTRPGVPTILTPQAPTVTLTRVQSGVGTLTFEAVATAGGR